MLAVCVGRVVIFGGFAVVVVVVVIFVGFAVVVVVVSLLFPGIPS